MVEEIVIVNEEVAVIYGVTTEGKRNYEVVNIVGGERRFVYMVYLVEEAIQEMDSTMAARKNKQSNEAHHQSSLFVVCNAILVTCTGGAKRKVYLSAVH